MVKGWLKDSGYSLDFLQKSHTDFIIACLQKSSVMLGLYVLFSLICFVINRGLYFRTTAGSQLRADCSQGVLTLTFFVYMFVNIGMVSGILAVVGYLTTCFSSVVLSIMNIMHLR